MRIQKEQPAKKKGKDEGVLPKSSQIRALEKEAERLIQDMDRFPRIEGFESLDEFYESFLAFQESVDACSKTADAILQDIRSARKKARSKADSDQETLTTYRKKAERLSREGEKERLPSAALQNKAKAIEEKKQQIQAAKEAAADGWEYLQIYDANMALLKKTIPLSETADHFVQSVKRNYPDHGKEIDRCLNQAIRIEDKSMDISYWMDDSRVINEEVFYKPRLADTVLAVVADKPGSSIPSALKMLDRGILAAGFLLCIGLAVLVSPKWIFLYVLIAGSVFGTTHFYVERKLYHRLPWDQLRQCRFLLKYDEKTAEVFSRMEFGLPKEEYENYVNLHADLEIARKEKYAYLEECMIDLDQQFKKAEAELIKEQRIDHNETAIREKQKKFEAIRRKCQAQKKELDQLEIEIREAHQEFTETESRYKKAVAALSGRKMQLRLQEELEELRSCFQAEEQRENACLQKSQEQALRQTQKELAEFQETAAENHRKLLQLEAIEAACRELSQKIHACKMRITSGDYWNICRKSLEEHPFTNAFCHEVSDHLWLLQEDGPKKIEHKNMPLILLVDYHGTNPAEDLKDLICKYINAIKEINHIQLVKFSVVDEFGDGGIFKSSRHLGIDFYGEQDLDQLERSFWKVETELKEEGIEEETVEGYNREVGAELLQISIKGCEYPYKMNYVFVLPSVEGKEAMNHADLWKRVRGNGKSYGFVPIFLILQTEWRKAEKEAHEKERVSGSLFYLQRLAADGKAAIIQEKQ